MANILDPSALLSSLPRLLPESKKLESPQDGLAALVHSALAAVGFRLVGIDDTAGASETSSDNVLPEGWNRLGPGSYTLKYRHSQSSLEFLVKIVRMSSMIRINSIASETRKIATLDIVTDEFLSPSFFPHTVGASEAGPLVHGFISSSRVSDFVSQLNIKIIQGLVPGLRKEGYTEEASDAQASSASSSAARPPGQGARPQPQPQPQRPDEQPRWSPLASHIPPANPLQIGRRDLDPLPAQIQPNPFAPPPLFSPNSGDGMYVGPDHPLFGGMIGGPHRGLGGPPGRGPWGGDGYLPPMGAPPGARFDPVGPDPGNPFGAGMGRGRGGGRRPPGSGEPDNDEFMPPGAENMFM